MTLKLGLTTTVVISSSAMAREALTKKDRRLAARPIRDATRALGWSDRSVGWLPRSNPLWRTFRRVMATHIFSQRSLQQDTHGLRERTVRDLVRYLRGRSGQEVAVGRVLLSSTLNLTSNILFSADIVDMEGGSPERLLETLEAAIDPLMWKPNVSDIFPLLGPLDIQGRRRMAAAHLKKLFSFLEGVVDRRLAEVDDKHNNDFLDVLLDLMSTGEMARDDAIALMFDILIAGGDPMSTTVEWALAELLHNPSTMSKVRTEMAAASFGCNSKQAIEEADLIRLPYLQAVVKEMQRLHPVSPLTLPHKAIEDGVEIGGYVIPKGGTVIINLSAVMRDPDVWEMPEEFVPERFIGTDGNVDMKGKDQFQYIPFGGGRRQCPGMALSERVVPLVLASLLQAFEWHLPDGMTSDKMDMNEMFVSANIRAVPLKAVPVVIM